MRMGVYTVKIAIIGAGAMGSIYGAYLSKRHEVCLIDKNEVIVEQINRAGVILQEAGKDTIYHPKACITSQKCKSFTSRTSTDFISLNL